MIGLALCLLQPVLPQAAPSAVLSPPTMQTVLVWSNSPSPGVSNRLYSWTGNETNVFEVGPTNVVRVTQRIEPRTLHVIKTVFNGVESEPSNVIGVPPKLVDAVYAQRDNGDIALVDVWTNPPALPAAQYRLRIQRTEDYSR